MAVNSILLAYGGDLGFYDTKGDRCDCFRTSFISYVVYCYTPVSPCNTNLLNRVHLAIEFVVFFCDVETNKFNEIRILIEW